MPKATDCTLTMGNGDTLKVRATRAGKGLVVHRHLTSKGAWSVTHKESGMVLAMRKPLMAFGGDPQFPSFKSADAAARDLALRADFTLPRKKLLAYLKERHITEEYLVRFLCNRAHQAWDQSRLTGKRGNEQ